MHKRRNRVLLTLAATVIASMALAGCTAGGSSNASGSQPIQVTFWQQKFEDYQQTWFKKYVDKYNASQSKVHVNLLVVPALAWQQKLKTAEAAGTQPDVATTNYGSIDAGVADGQFADLDGLLPASTFSDIKSNVKSFVTVGGKHYGYPMLVEPSTVLYYRTDLVKAAGLDPNTPPTTWAELTTWARALTKGNVKGITTASVAPDLQWSSWGLQENACGHFPIDSTWSQATATDPCYTQLLQFYKTLYQDKLMPAQSALGYADATPYGQGQVAMMVDGSWAVGQLKNTWPKMLAKTQVAPMPSAPDAATKTTATLGGWTLTVDSKSKDKQASADFIHYLLAGNPAIMADFFKTSGFSKFTVRTSVDQLLSKDPAASNDAFMQIISKQILPNGVQEPVYPLDISTAMGTAIEAAMKGTSSIPAALQTANASINSTIKNQQLAGTEPKN
jgi:multiple sugar transport system substrate-binding protein